VRLDLDPSPLAGRFDDALLCPSNRHVSAILAPFASGCIAKAILQAARKCIRGGPCETRATELRQPKVS
jgi:hypothetical protein